MTNFVRISIFSIFNCLNLAEYRSIKVKTVYSPDSWKSHILHAARIRILAASHKYIAPEMQKTCNKHKVLLNPLPHMPILGSSNSAANKDVMSQKMTNGDTIFRLSRKNCGKRRNCS